MRNEASRAVWRKVGLDLNQISFTNAFYAPDTRRFNVKRPAVKVFFV